MFSNLFLLKAVLIEKTNYVIILLLLDLGLFMIVVDMMWLVLSKKLLALGNSQNLKNYSLFVAMKTSLFLLIISFWIIMACHPELAMPNCTPIVVISNIDTLKTNELFTIQEATINATNLEVKLAYGGGCDPNHKFELFVAQNHLVDSVLPYFDAKIIFTTNDYCKRLDYKTQCFDIKALKNQYKSGILNIKGYKPLQW